jgi:heme-degrading monooxygenase HmoA
MKKIAHKSTKENSLLSNMICTLTIVRYPKWLGWAGFLSMALFRLPLATSTPIRFWKLLGCGRNGTFDKLPDWRQWGVLAVWSSEPGSSSDSKLQTPNFLLAWWKFFRCEICTFTLEPIEGHGTWDKQQCFGALPRQSDFDGMIAVLTRATIRAGKLGSFWKNVDRVAAHMAKAHGFISSIGIGEVPWIKQATFSIWKSKSAMKAFAYQSHQHAEVIRKTRSEDWYSEEMFVRFMIHNVSGTIDGRNPLERKT